MMVFDTDMLSLVFRGNLAYQSRFHAVPVAERYVSVINCEEVYRGRLNAIRQADARKNLAQLIAAYDELGITVSQLGRLRVLPYKQLAHELYTNWRSEKVRIGTQDLRIAAICVAHDATLVSRNQRDFDKVPELKLTVCN